MVTVEAAYRGGLRAACMLGPFRGVTGCQLAEEAHALVLVSGYDGVWREVNIQMGRSEDVSVSGVE